MSLTNQLVLSEIFQNGVIEEVIKLWESKYEVSSTNTMKISQESLDAYITDENFKNELKQLLNDLSECKSLIEFEIKCIKEIRSELEDCQIVKDLKDILRKTKELNNQQNIEIKKIMNENSKLMEDKIKLENKLKDTMGYSSSFISNERVIQSATYEYKTEISEKIEDLFNNNDSRKKPNKVLDYCHIAPSITLFSDSEKSISEEDSLEKEKNKEITLEQNYLEEFNISKCKFSSGIESATQSTPIKSIHDDDNSEVSIQNFSNLTHDLKELQNYILNCSETSLINNSNFIDWDLSQFNVSNNSIVSHKNIKQINNSSLYESQCPTEQNFNHIKDQIKQLYEIMFLNPQYQDNAVLKKPGNQNESEPSKQLENLLLLVEDTKENSTDFVENENTNKSVIVFQSLSEISIKLLSRLVKELCEINELFVGKDTNLQMQDDYTESITKYLNYLMTLSDVDFDFKSSQNHIIFDLLKEFRERARLVNDIIQETGNSRPENCKSITNGIESQFKNQNDQNVQRSLLCDFLCYIQENLTLYETNRQLKNDIEQMQIDLNNQSIKQRKLMDEYDRKIDEFCLEIEDVNLKHKNDKDRLENIIEQLERRLDVEKKFIIEQQNEWEMERSQHIIEVDNLNKSIWKLKQLNNKQEQFKNILHTSDINSSKKKPILSDKQKSSHTQTKHAPVIFIAKNLTLKDLENYSEFKQISKDWKRRYSSIFDYFKPLSNVIIEISIKLNHQKSISHLHQIQDKSFEFLVDLSDEFWKEFSLQISQVKDKYNLYVSETTELKNKFDSLQDSIEVFKTNDQIDKCRIKTLEEEIRNLVEYQKNFSIDYNVIQNMLEDKDKEIEKLTDQLLKKEDEVVDLNLNINTLKLELNESHNILSERDEDIYVLKEEKENLVQEIQLTERKVDQMIESHKVMYSDLESELNDSQNNSQLLQNQVKLLKEKLKEKENCVANNVDFEDYLKNQIDELTSSNHDLILNLENIKDELKLSELRFHEYKTQQKKEREMLNKTLEETEADNTYLRKKLEKPQTSVSSQTDNIHIYCDTNCIQIQEKLGEIIDELKSDYNSERDMRKALETKFRENACQYQVLSQKIHTLENITKSQKSDDISAMESVELNDILNESINSDESNYTLDKKKISAVKINSSTQTDMDFDRLFYLKENMPLYDSQPGSNLSDWVKKLLEEMEHVLEKCIFNNNPSNEIMNRFQAFKNIVEQFYKNQISSLMDKTIHLESILNSEKQTSKELKYKANFLMKELQETEAKVKDLQNGLEQEIALKNRINDSNQNLTRDNKIFQSELNEKIYKIKNELSQEKLKNSDLEETLKVINQKIQKLESTKIISEERINLTENANVELIKKNRQLIDYQQKEIDNFNLEYAEIFKRCNSYKLQIETLQQDAEHRNLEYNKTKAELIETINSNSEYRNKMNEYVKVYQERRQKLENEMNELHQMLQLSCRREVTMIKENETLRLKFHSTKNNNRELESKISELQSFISESQIKHEKDRQEWLKMIKDSHPQSVKTNDDSSIINQVNWLLRMLQLRIELLVLHYNTSEETTNQTNHMNNYEIDILGRPYSAKTFSFNHHNNNELVMLLQSIKSMQSMINIYLKTNSMVYERSIKKMSINGSRPKPTGSSDSIDALSDSENNSISVENNDVCSIEPLNQKLQYIQSNQIKSLENKLEQCQKYKCNLMLQIKYICSRMNFELRLDIMTSQFSQSQKVYSRNHYYKFKFKSICKVIMIVNRFLAISRKQSYCTPLIDKLKSLTSKIPQPLYSTQQPYLAESHHNYLSNVKKSDDFDHNNSLKPRSSFESGSYNNSNKVENPKIFSYNTNKQYNGNTANLTYNLSLSSFTNHRYKFLQNETRQSASNSKFRSTIQQIDDFGKRLDKYSDDLE